MLIIWVLFRRRTKL